MNMKYPFLLLLPLVLAGKKYPEMNGRMLPVAQRLGITDILKK